MQTSASASHKPRRSGEHTLVLLLLLVGVTVVAYIVSRNRSLRHPLPLLI